MCADLALTNMINITDKPESSSKSKARFKHTLFTPEQIELSNFTFQLLDPRYWNQNTKSIHVLSQHVYPQASGAWTRAQCSNSLKPVPKFHTTWYGNRSMATCSNKVLKPAAWQVTDFFQPTMLLFPYCFRNE
jgi:hypothetical protein